MSLNIGDTLLIRFGNKPYDNTTWILTEKEEAYGMWRGIDGMCYVATSLDQEMNKVRFKTHQFGVDAIDIDLPEYKEKTNYPVVRIKNLTK